MTAPTAGTPFNTDLPNYKNLPKLLVGQKALVTGANSGIGQACAIALARAGADVVVNYVVGETDKVIKAIEAEGAKASPSRRTCRTRPRSTPCSSRRSKNSARSTSWWPTPACSATPRSST